MVGPGPESTSWHDERIQKVLQRAKPFSTTGPQAGHPLLETKTPENVFAYSFIQNQEKKNILYTHDLKIEVRYGKIRILTCGLQCKFYAVQPSIYEYLKISRLVLVKVWSLIWWKVKRRQETWNKMQHVTCMLFWSCNHVERSGFHLVTWVLMVLVFARSRWGRTRWPCSQRNWSETARWLDQPGAVPLRSESNEPGIRIVYYFVYLFTL